MLTVSQSNHKALLLDLRQVESVKRKTNRVFRFEPTWLLDEDGAPVIEEAWDRYTTKQNPLKVQEKLNSCKGVLMF